MRRLTIGLIAVTVLISSAFVLQLRDIANSVDGVILQPAKQHTAVDTSTGITLAGYVGSGVFVTTGVMIDGNNSKTYMVLQDSGSTATWANRDSVALDSTDEKYYEMHIRRYQANQKIRTIFRAPAAADTLNFGSVILRVCQRAPC